MHLNYLKRKNLLFFISFMLQSAMIWGQQVQTLRGTVVDQQSKSGIEFVSVSLPGTTIGTLTDSNGHFVISDVPLGRTSLQLNHISYEPLLLHNIVIEGGKETVLNLEMLEQVRRSQAEVTIIGKRERSTIQQMATSSVMEFNAEDSRRYAGSRNDVARMATNFAGVNSANDASNDVVIRGNSPLGLLWRMEGVDIPNPNHFGSLGATGGAVSMLNNNVVGQSAFYTGAFPAQFGNAVAGAFDISLRTGNNHKREFTAQVGFNGLELGAEGPFSSKSNASYLLYYRYSIPGLLKSLGVDVGTGAAVPAYQDISFKVELPTAKAGRFVLFGIGGKSSINFLGDIEDTANFYNDPYHDLYNATKMGVAGLKHTYFFNSKTSSVLTLAATGAGVTTRQDSLDIDGNPHKNYRESGNEWRYVANWVLNKKFSASDRLSGGLSFDQLHYSYKDSIRDARYGFIPFLQEKNHTELIRAFLQWQHRFNDRLTLNSGVYSQYLTLNKKISVEARLGLQYKLLDAAVVSLAYGMHSQMQTLMTYFYESKVGENFVQTNRNLGFTKSRHLVAGWEHSLPQGWKYKVEGYMQHLNGVPVENRPSDWSALNMGAGYGAGLEDSLVNKGKGFNYGAELTVEKPFSNGYYLLATASVFDSKYKGSNGVEHNTIFNGRYVFNVLAGKEWKINDMHGVGIDFKVTTAGGKRYTPINEQASNTEGRVIYFDEQSFEKQTKAYFRLDLKLTYRMNYKGFMQEFFVDFQNLTNHKNVLNQWYDSRTGMIRTQNQLGFWPNFNYRIQF